MLIRCISFLAALLIYNAWSHLRERKRQLFRKPGASQFDLRQSEAGSEAGPALGAAVTSDSALVLLDKERKDLTAVFSRFAAIIVDRVHLPDHRTHVEYIMSASLLRQPSCDLCSPSTIAMLSARPISKKCCFGAHTMLGAAYIRPLRAKSLHTKGKGMLRSAQQTQTEITREEQTEDIYRISLRTSEARKSIRLAQSRDGRIVIEAVAIGSEAEEVHVQ